MSVENSLLCARCARSVVDEGKGIDGTTSSYDTNEDVIVECEPNQV